MRLGEYGCDLCPDLFWNIFSFVILIFALILAIVFLVKSQLGGATEKKPLYSVYYKIFLNHF